MASGAETEASNCDRDGLGMILKQLEYLRVIHTSVQQLEAKFALKNLPLTLLASSVEWKFASEDYTFRRLLVSHVHELLRLEDQLDDLSEEEKMEQMAEDVVALQKSKLGADHPATLRSMGNLAIWYSETGRGAEALQLTEEVLALRKSKPGADHPETLTSMHNLAIHYGEAGRRTEALQLTEEVVALHNSKLGAERSSAFQAPAVDNGILPPGKNWSQGFYKHYSELKARRVQALDWARHDVVKLRLSRRAASLITRRMPLSTMYCACTNVDILPCSDSCDLL
ncbi:hypothetical protein LTR93_011117 [Exophiala xenobiotica]|nr:hypothetical protein LTR93_011117 [Exophiala xenobiotica]